MVSSTAQEQQHAQDVLRCLLAAKATCYLLDVGIKYIICLILSVPE